MNRVNQILNHDLFIKCMKNIKKAEKKRKFCHHDLYHLLTTARIAMILNLEDKLRQPRELIYGAALLHDIGRHRQYRKGIPHEIASVQLAPQILKDCGFDECETDVIVEAIRNHRNKEVSEEANLSGLLYRADKQSRQCYACQARKECRAKRIEKEKGLLV